MVMSARVTDALTCIPPRKIRARLLGGKHTSLKFLVEVSLLKNSFALSPAPGSGAEYAVLVVSRPCFRALLDRLSDRRLLFQQAGAFCELRIDGFSEGRPGPGSQHPARLHPAVLLRLAAPSAALRGELPCARPTVDDVFALHAP